VIYFATKPSSDLPPSSVLLCIEIIAVIKTALDDRDKERKEKTVVIYRATITMAQKLYERVGFVNVVHFPVPFLINIVYIKFI
jgi:hypothetical protein